MTPSSPPSPALERASAIVEDADPSEFASYGIGRLLTYSAALASLVEPYVPDPLRSDAQWLRLQIDSKLREVLAVCVLSVADVLGGDDWNDETPRPTPTSSQLQQMRESYFTRHFSDILCDGGFWPIVDNIRGEIDLDEDGS